MITRSQRKQQGSTLVVVLAAFLVILVVVIGVVVSSKARNKETTKTQSTATSSSQKSSTSSQPKKTATTPKATGSGSTPVDSATQARNDLNAQRKADAVATAATVRKFMDDNVGDWPDYYDNGSLGGSGDDVEEPVNLTYYPDIIFVSGLQQADTDDTLVIVSSATCSAGATTIDSDSQTGLAVQYSVQQANGDFTGGCTNV